MSDQIVGLIIPGMCLVFALGTFALWLADRSKRYILGFLAAPVAMGISLSLNHYSHDFDGTVTQGLMHACSIIACMAFIWAVATRLASPIPYRSWMLLLAIVLGLNLAEMYYDSFVATFLIVNLACGVVFLLAAQSLAHSGSRELVDRFMVVSIALVAIQFFVRPVMVIMIDMPTSAADYRESAGHAVLTVSAAILMLTVAIAALATVIFDRFADIRERSARDPLTGLPLRRAFEEDVARLLEESRSTSVPVSLIIADIDHFKQVNDLWGHLAGDRAIASFGDLIGKTIRDSDRAGRVGGEEFCILVWNCNEKEAGGLAERLRVAFASMQHDGINSDVRLTASFGVAGVMRGAGYTKTFALADRALYRAKDLGRNRVETASAANAEVSGSADTSESPPLAQVATLR